MGEVVEKRSAGKKDVHLRRDIDLEQVEGNMADGAKRKSRSEGRKSGGGRVKSTVQEGYNGRKLTRLPKSGARAGAGGGGGGGGGGGWGGVGRSRSEWY